MAKIVLAESSVHQPILRMTGARPTGTFASLKGNRTNPRGVTSRSSLMQLSHLRQTIRSDRDVVMALACPDRREIDLLQQSVGPTTMVGWRS
jgi:hypothetical protein